MNLSQFSKLLCAGLVTLTGLASPAATGYTKPETKSISQRAKETRIEMRQKSHLNVPRLDGRAGRLREIPRIGSRTLVEPQPQQAPAKITSEEAGRIYGGLIYADDWTQDNQPVGIYSFPISDGAQLRGDAIGNEYVVTGGVYANGEYHFISYMSFMGMTFADLYTCDIETWTISRAMPVGSGAIPQDMAYDPTTGNVYGCFLNDNADGWVLGALNLETGERRLLKDLDIIILAVGVNSKGEWYGVGYDGNFYRFDKETGERTLIGSTGRHPMYSSSGCFDLKTDRFYWECIESDSKGILYEIDVNTGAATMVTQLANNAEMVGMFIPVPEAEDAAPAAVSDLEFYFSEGALTGDVCFTMPSMQFDGKASLSGTLSYSVSINEKETATGTAMPGEEVSVNLTLPAPGMYRANVCASNAVGRSPMSLTESWIGHDMPGAVENLTLVPGEGMTEIILSWDTPTTALNGGYVDPAGITYNIVRMPGETKVASNLAATTFTETIPEPSTITLYHYIVTPVYNGAEGASTASAQLPIGCASVPLYNYISSEEDFAYFQVIDANGDGETWQFDPAHISARIKYSLANDAKTPMDDWLVTPRIRLKAGRMYRFALDAGCYFSYMPERLEVKMGKTATPEGMNIDVIPATVVGNTTPSTLEGWINVETDGVYFFGIHAISGADTMFLYVSNVEIEEGPLLGTPGLITGLTAKAGANGQLQATLSGTAPTTTVDGKPLDSIEEIRIERDGRYVESIKGVAPGARFEYVDNNAVQSDNTYTLSAVNSIGAGYKAKTSVYVGHDRPGLPVNVHAAYNNDGSVTLTWDAPTEGETGGYFDPSALTYTVLRANDEAELAVGLKDLTYTDQNVPLNGFRQEFYGYYVYAQSPAGYGYGQLSNIVCVGNPYRLPFIETFANGKIINNPWDVSYPEDSGAYWQLRMSGEYPETESQDPEGGLVTFIPEEAGDEGTLTSGTISLSGAVNPVVEFWWYYVPDSYDSVKLLLSRDGGDFKEIGEVRAAAESGAEGWRKKSVELTDLDETRFIQIAFEARSGAGYTNIHLDNIRVKNVFDHNLAALAVQAPDRMKIGEKGIVKVLIENSGLLKASGYSVSLYREDTLIATQEGPAIEPDGFSTLDFEITPEITWEDPSFLMAIINYEADGYREDNMSPQKDVILIAPRFPAVNDLSGTNDSEGHVILTWSEPEMTEGTGTTVTDGAEDYRDFAISGYGDWWTVDADGLPTFGIANNTGGAVVYENAGKPQAFMVFNPSAAGVPTEYGDGNPTGWAPRTGDSYFASFGNDGQSDNWLISPELPGVAQTISFYVKSQTADYGYEKFEVWYSKGSADLSDFERIGDLRSAPIAWVEERVDLPAGTRYFAIRCVSQDAYVFMVDDITYLPMEAVTEELSLMGYNIYRDAVRVNERPGMDMTFTDDVTDSRSHSYAVTVVYDKGESKFSNVVRLAYSGMALNPADGVRVATAKGMILVEASAGDCIRIASTDGRLVAENLSTGADAFPMQAGTYVVTINGRSVKVIVR